MSNAGYIDFTDSIQDAKKGDSQAFTFIYDQTNGYFRSIIVKYAGDNSETEDVLQEVYLEIFRKLGTLKDPKTFIKWGATICRNTAINELDKRSAKKRSSIEYLPPASEEEDGYGLDEFASDDLDSRINPEAHIDKMETKRLLGEILDTLPQNQRTCILLWQEQLSMREIAGMTGIPEGSVKSNISYAKKKIKTKVEELEKQGTKLYGMAPIPFFIWLLKNADAGMEVSSSQSAATLNKVLSRVPITDQAQEAFSEAAQTIMHTPASAESGDAGAGHAADAFSHAGEQADPGAMSAPNGSAPAPEQGPVSSDLSGAGRADFSKAAGTHGAKASGASTAKTSEAAAAKTAETSAAKTAGAAAAKTTGAAAAKVGAGKAAAVIAAVIIGAGAVGGGAAYVRNSNDAAVEDTAETIETEDTAYAEEDINAEEDIYEEDISESEDAYVVTGSLRINSLSEKDAIDITEMKLTLLNSETFESLHYYMEGDMFIIEDVPIGEYSVSFSVPEYGDQRALTWQYEIAIERDKTSIINVVSGSTDYVDHCYPVLKITYDDGNMIYGSFTREETEILIANCTTIYDGEDGPEIEVDNYDWSLDNDAMIAKVLAEHIDIITDED